MNIWGVVVTNNSYRIIKKTTAKSDFAKFGRECLINTAFAYLALVRMEWLGANKPHLVRKSFSFPFIPTQTESYKTPTTSITLCCCSKNGCNVPLISCKYRKPTTAIETPVVAALKLGLGNTKSPS